MSIYSLLISIKPEHAKKIFSGEKTVELRRVRPKLSNGDAVLVYVSSPTMALVGAFEVDRVIELSPESLWEEVKISAGITLDVFSAYYKGTDKAFGIVIKKSWNFDTPLSLENLKSKWINFHPPQSYKYISAQEINLLRVSFNLNTICNLPT